MKKNISLLVLCYVCRISIACDVCGCSLGGFSQGVMPNFNSHLIGIRYNQAIFQSKIDHTSINNGVEISRDQYFKYELFGRYNLNERIKLNFSVPYAYNQMVGSHESSHSGGLGDPVILVQYQLLRKDRIMKDHFLTVGGGLKLPLGKYNLEENNQLINRNFQPGTGSVDFISNVNYFYRKDKSALQIESAYKINTQNKFQYRFGNQFNITTNYVYIAGRNKFNFIAFSGLYYESAAKHLENSNVVFNTGGSLIFANCGMQFYLNKIRFGTSFQYPVYQKYKTDNITQINASFRLAFDIVFFLKKE